MCTAISYRSDDHYFGRNLDIQRGFTEQVTITPRNYPFHLRNGAVIKQHYAMIGMATISDGYPLYYDAVNECGLCIAGLNFPEYAYYQDDVQKRDAIAPFELIPWILGHCQNVSCARKLLERTGIWNKPFTDQYPLTPMHWIIADNKESITVEPVADGLRVFSNPIGILTNSPPFEYHLQNLRNYLNLSSENPKDTLGTLLGLTPCSKGTGALGLPGDYTSASRFIKAAFIKAHAPIYQEHSQNISHFFHMLESVAPPMGCVQTADGAMHTIYACCCNANRGIYYYKTWGNSQITGIDMRKESLDSDKIITYPLRTTANIRWENR